MLRIFISKFLKTRICLLELIKKIDEICSTLKMFSGQTIDLTVLSFEEEKQTDFLNRLNSMYIKIK